MCRPRRSSAPTPRTRPMPLAPSGDAAAQRVRGAAGAVGRSLVGLAAILLALAGSADASGPVDASPRDPGPVLVLTHESLGMTAEQIEASQAAIEAAPARTGAMPGGEVQARADALAIEAEAARQRAREAAERAEAAMWAVEAAEAGLVPGIGDDRTGAASYATCVEALIRHGDTYAKSSRTCRAIFEEPDVPR